MRFLLGFTLIFSLHSAAQTLPARSLMGKTTGVLPYLKYGLGDDRLGGAKMSFLDTAVVMTVTDSTKDDFKVKLSHNHSAYIPKSNFVIDTTLKPKLFYLSSSVISGGDSLTDYVSIMLDEKLPYRTIQQINPSRIVLEIFGATSNTNWITQRTTAREVKNIYYEQPEDDLFRLVIELNHPQHWGYAVFYKDKRLMIKIRRQPENLSLSNLKVAVDAGHGGDNSGASGKSTKILEKKYTLLIAQELEKQLLLDSATVIMTRQSDSSVSMIERQQYLQTQNPDFMVSIHLNSASNDSIKGVSTYYRYIGFRPLSQYILKHLLGLGLKEFGNVGSFNFSLNGPTDYPNCLVEVAFLSNREDEQLILDPEFRKAVAVEITEGIKEWLKECAKTNQ